MRTLFFVILTMPVFIFGQSINYSPNRKSEVTVPLTYYNTEYIFIKNTTTTLLSLEFEVLENSLDPNWSATLCTNKQCLNNIIPQGSLGELLENQEAYISINLSANETEGDGSVKFLITSPTNNELSDTLTFIYHVNEDGKVKSQPWAQVNIGNGVLTVLLENAENKATLQLFNLEGKVIYDLNLEPITSMRLADHPKGIYLLAISDEKGRNIRRKIVNY